VFVISTIIYPVISFSSQSLSGILNLESGT